MSKLFFMVLFYGTLFLPPAFSLSLIDIDDPSKDKELSAKYLPRYVQQIFKSRADYLRSKKDHIQSEGFVSLGETRNCPNLVKTEIILIPAQSSSQRQKKLEGYIKSYEDWLKFYEEDSLKLPVQGGGFYMINLLTADDRALYYMATASTLYTAYRKVRKDIENLSAHVDQHKLLTEPLVADEENALEDFESILRTLRPHCRKDNLTLTPIGKQFYEKGNKILRDLALLECAYQWRDLFSTRQVEEAYRQAVILAHDQKVPEKPTATITPLIERPKKEKIEVPEEKVEVPQEKVEVSQERAEMLQNKVEVLPPFKKEKIKTRPSDSEKFLQSLNGLFEDDPAFDKARDVLRENPAHAPQPMAIKSDDKTLTAHARRLKILEKLLNPEKSHHISVEKTLCLLKDFGFIKENVSCLNHKQMKVKPVELWLNGERTLIEIPPVTLAVAHKSGSKRYFKPYIVDRIRKALEKAGFKKLLEK